MKKRNTLIPFSPPHIKPEAIDEVVDTLKSGWITTGPKTKLFEKRITDYCGCTRTLCVNSATFGLEIILRWFGVGVGDEVIIPAYTYAATANVVLHTGATPVMVDVNHDDFNISLSEIRNAISKHTKVIIPVDIAGLPVDNEAINQMVDEPQIKNLFSPDSENQRKLNRILILSDSAHSFGASYLGKKVGSLTDITVFSFHAVKNLTTAEGGAIALNMRSPFNNDTIYQDLNIESLHGQSKDALAKSKKGAWKYDVVSNGYKGNMTDIQASLGLIGLKYYESETLLARKNIVEIYNKYFDPVEWAQTPIFEENGKLSSYHLYLLRIWGINEKQRDRIIEKITEKNISVNVHFQPLPLFTSFKDRGYKMNSFPVSYDNYAREISLPVYQDLSHEDVKYISKSVILIVSGEMGS